MPPRVVPAALAAALVPSRPSLPSPRAAASALLMLVAALACSGESGGAAAAAERVARRPPPVIPVPETPYVPTTVVADGWIAGTVEADSVPRDTTVTPTHDQQVCGRSLVVRTTPRSGARIGNVVVWLEGIRSGKALPRSRRFAVTVEGCQLEPRVQAVVAGGMLNVRSADPLRNRLRVGHEGELVALVRFTDRGQVVPVPAALARPGLVTITSEVHPWLRGYVVVLDHPYVDVTPATGEFRMENVPPGTYRLVTWHERFGRTEREITVREGVETRVSVRLGGGTAAD